ncbi:hypothetical protein GCM10027570_55300 [Streptomonospora sediminis]
MRRRHTGGSDSGALHWSMLATLFATVIVAVALVVASPFGLRAFGGPDGEWQRLSFIGQTYGAVSALIAAVALVGIIATLVLQARETRRGVQESRRQAMSELLQKAMDDPALDECWGPVPEHSDPKVRKQQLYVNMIVSQWGVAYETGAMPEKRLRAIARDMFSAPPGRTYWQRAGPQRLAVVTEGKAARFNRMLDEEFRRTSDVTGRATPPSPSAGQRGSAERSTRDLLTGAAAGGLAVGAVIAAAAFVRRRRIPGSYRVAGDRRGRVDRVNRW